MQEPPAGAVIRISTSYTLGRGYTYLAIRATRSKDGDASWYPTGIQQSRNPIYIDMEPQFPFWGTVTWQQIVDFADGRKIEIATDWEPHPEWIEPPFEERIRRNRRRQIP
jgi:hypothetical protein